MPKRSSSFELSLPSNDEGLLTYEWLYQRLRSQILEGTLRPGLRLPSTREIAQRYGLARGTVSNAFDLLKSEGYLHSASGSGTFVSEVLPDDLLRVRRDGVAAKASVMPRRFTRYASRVDVNPNFEDYAMRAFRPHLPAVDLFPAKLWGSIAARIMRTPGNSMLMATPAKGYLPLREAVCEYLNTWRGVRCAPEQIVIVSGVQEAVDMCARMLIEPGDRVCVEDPGYEGASYVFRSAGATIVPVPVDEEGMELDRAALHDARLIYLTPGHQAPLGVTMSLRRRLALLEYAKQTNAVIFEDDYDSEYRYSSRPIPAMQGLDESGCVVFAGSFNKVLFPSLRLGYVVAPPDLAAKFEAIKSQTSRHAPVLDQLILHEFITKGHFARHLRRMREIYAERLQTLLDEARAHLGGLLEVSDIEAGLETVGWLQPGLDSVSVGEAALARGIVVTPLQNYAHAPLRRDGIQLGFAAVTPGQIRYAVRELAGVLSSNR